MVTVRYAEPKAFQMFTHRIARPDGCAPTPEAMLAGLFETIIDRAADVLQMTGARLDGMSTPSSRAGRSREPPFGVQDTLRALGRHET